ncbi:unnamed protein product [Schistosoma curassoni]|uniref:Uncharacterized protein n=1 Tax=Schistosoma curassoni TaxID=6186 RepID=A0A183KSZ2_9TREM|nr:unnamed protein product [Schistosoma curassoni]
MKKYSCLLEGTTFSDRNSGFVFTSESPGPSESFSTELLAQSALDKYSDQSDYSFSDDSNQYSSLLSCQIPCDTQQRTVRDSDDHKSKLITRKECSGVSNVLLSRCPSSRSNLARNRFERTASLKRTPVFYEKHTDDSEKRRSGSCNFVSKLVKVLQGHFETAQTSSVNHNLVIEIRRHLNGILMTEDKRTDARTIWETGRVFPIAEEMRRYNLEVLGISETHWTKVGQQRLASKELLLYSGHEEENAPHTQDFVVISRNKQEKKISRLNCPDLLYSKLLIGLFLTVTKSQKILNDFILPELDQYTHDTTTRSSLDGILPGWFS